MLIYPLVDTALETASWERFGGPGEFLSRAFLVPLLDGYLPPAVDRTDPRVSPLRAPDLRGVAPALVVGASCDPIRDESEAYAQKLREANVAADYVEYPGLVHGFAQLCAVLDAGARAVDEIGAALHRRFYRIGAEG
jgi:acetyl esterase